MSVSFGLFIAFLGQPWPVHSNTSTLRERIAVPAGYERVALKRQSFGSWLRRLPLRADRPAVLLFNGAKKANQDAHYAVIDIDVGKRNLQQCADAVMRLRAEYLWAAGRKDDVCFRFTSGDPASWSKWKLGVRPKIKGNKVTWSRRAKENTSYANFRRYLNQVFTYAGTYSLTKELNSVADPSKVEVGDIFIQGGFPGHAVIVVDVAANKKGDRIFLLAQSYMPAQNMHVLVNPRSSSPWYSAKKSGVLQTPEWAFKYGQLKRFSAKPCP